jgi:hypothetical protein
MSAALAALLGALIGAAASITTIVIQQRYQHKRELLKIAAEIALQDYKQRLELLNKSGGGRMPPVSAFVHYQMQVFEDMLAGTYTPEVIKKLSEENDRILSAYAKGTDERVAAKRNAT